MLTYSEKKFPKKINSLDAIFDFVEDFIADNQHLRMDSNAINFAVEEIFTNLVKYNTESKRDILIELEIIDSDLVTSLTDFNVSKFDITEVDEVDTTLGVEERKVGGLGLHLVNKFVDKLEYEYKNSNSKITLLKHLEKANV